MRFTVALTGRMGLSGRFPRAMPWAMEDIGLSARTGHVNCNADNFKTQNSKLRSAQQFLLRQAAKPITKLKIQNSKLLNYGN